MYSKKNVVIMDKKEVLLEKLHVQFVIKFVVKHLLQNVIMFQLEHIVKENNVANIQWEEKLQLKFHANIQEQNNVLKYIIINAIMLKLKIVKEKDVVNMVEKVILLELFHVNI